MRRKRHVLKNYTVRIYSVVVFQMLMGLAHVPQRMGHQVGPAQMAGLTPASKPKGRSKLIGIAQ